MEIRPDRAEKVEAIRQLTLERVRTSVSQFVSGMVIEELTVEESVDLIARDMVVAILRMNVPGKVTKVGEYSFPKTWWDAVKKRWLPWLQREETSFTCSTYHICPHLNIGCGVGSHREWLFEAQMAAESAKVEP